MTKEEFLKKLLEVNSHEAEDGLSKKFKLLMKLSSNGNISIKPTISLSEQVGRQYYENLIEGINVSIGVAIFCIKTLIEEGIKKPGEGKGENPGEPRKPYVKLSWDEIFIHSLEKYKSIKDRLKVLREIIINSNSNVNKWSEAINEFLDKWALFVRYLEDEKSHIEKELEAKNPTFIEFKKNIFKKLNNLSDSINKYDNFIKCISSKKSLEEKNLCSFLKSNLKGN